MEKVVEGKLTVEDYGRYVNISKQVYVNCDCGSSGHIGRWIVDRYICKDDGHEECNIFYENNAAMVINPNYFCPSNNKFVRLFSRFLWFFKLVYKRIELSLRILLDNALFLPTDFVWSFDTVERFKHTITDAVNEVKSYKTGFEIKKQEVL